MTEVPDRPHGAHKDTRRGLAVVGSLMLAGVVGAVGAYANNVNYVKGQGLIADGFGGYDLVTELCAALDENGNIINGADAQGPYLLWVLTATGAKNADITVFGTTVSMTKTGNGTFKYVSGWYEPSTLPGNGAPATTARPKTQLTISHGCRPFIKSAWCSPGFWRNATDAAWALTGYSRTDLFNATVYDSFYGATFLVDPTLNIVLTTTGGTYKGPGVAGTDPRTQTLPLNAFNATGAFLTDHIAGFAYDPAVLSDDDSDTCPDRPLRQLQGHLVVDGGRSSLTIS